MRLSDDQMLIPAETVVKLMAQEAEAMERAGDPEAAERLRRWAVKSGNLPQLRNMIELAKGHLHSASRRGTVGHRLASLGGTEREECCR